MSTGRKDPDPAAAAAAASGAVPPPPPPPPVSGKMTAPAASTTAPADPAATADPAASTTTTKTTTTTPPSDDDAEKAAKKAEEKAAREKEDARNKAISEAYHFATAKYLDEIRVAYFNIDDPAAKQERNPTLVSGDPDAAIKVKPGYISFTVNGKEGSSSFLGYWDGKHLKILKDNPTMADYLAATNYFAERGVGQLQVDFASPKAYSAEKAINIVKMAIYEYTADGKPVWEKDPVTGKDKVDPSTGNKIHKWKEPPQSFELGPNVLQAIEDRTKKRNGSPTRIERIKEKLAGKFGFKDATNQQDAKFGKTFKTDPRHPQDLELLRLSDLSKLRYENWLSKQKIETPDVAPTTTPTASTATTTTPDPAAASTATTSAAPAASTATTTTAPAASTAVTTDPAPAATAKMDSAPPLVAPAVDAKLSTAPPADSGLHDAAKRIAEATAKMTAAAADAKPASTEPVKPADVEPAKPTLEEVLVKMEHDEEARGSLSEDNVKAVKDYVEGALAIDPKESEIEREEKQSVRDVLVEFVEQSSKADSVDARRDITDAMKTKLEDLHATHKITDDSKTNAQALLDAQTPSAGLKPGSPAGTHG